MELKINRVQYEVSDLDELRVRLAQIRRTQFSEVWLQHTDGWPAIAALINAEAAWLMYLRHEGDAGFSTRNPQYSGLAKTKTEYYLSNGQRDEYPASWNITSSEALRALEYFFEQEAMAPWLTWQDDTLKPKL
ncbi:MAG TPA: Imm1 family immunity protein [Candidatus Acidoferrum sp.]|nr:Imm1 family immunity protein [Candidatus Acidoferrum sp.]